MKALEQYRLSGLQGCHWLGIWKEKFGKLEVHFLLLKDSSRITLLEIKKKSITDRHPLEGGREGFLEVVLKAL